jgi:hypothetical protein
MEKQTLKEALKDAARSGDMERIQDAHEKYQTRQNRRRAASLLFLKGGR